MKFTTKKCLKLLKKSLRNLKLGWPTDNGIVQINIVAHTGTDGFFRLAR